MPPQYWSNAATLMIAAKFAQTASVKQLQTGNSAIRNLNFDYKLLMLKRNPKSSFMGSAFVFPGGRTSSVDTNIKNWESLFTRSLEINSSQLFNMMHILAPKHLSMMSVFPKDAQKMSNTSVQFLDLSKPYTHFVKTSVNTDLESMWGIVQHRLSAIRETFEEVGILLYTDKQSLLARHNKGIHNVTPKSIPHEDLLVWQSEINENSSNFFTMFKELEIMPDIWALNEWSNWLTPVNMGKVHGNRRFDTMFYLGCLANVPEHTADGYEIIGDQWCTPIEALEQYKKKECWMAPPQLLELSRMCMFPRLDDLKKFSEQRSVLGVGHTMPVHVKCADGDMLLLPGDNLYPTKPDYLGMYESTIYKETREELRDQSLPLNRIEIIDRWTLNPIINVESKFGHVSPNSGLDLYNKM